MGPGLTASLSDADVEVDELLDTEYAGICVSLPGLRATSGVLPPLEGFLRSRRDMDVGGIQRRDCCGWVR